MRGGGEQEEYQGGIGGLVSGALDPRGVEGLHPCDVGCIASNLGDQEAGPPCGVVIAKILPGVCQRILQRDAQVQVEDGFVPEGGLTGGHVEEDGGPRDVVVVGEGGVEVGGLGDGVGVPPQVGLAEPGDRRVQGSLDLCVSIVQ